MSNRIGVIISAEITENILDDIRQKYGFQLIPVENPTLNKSLEKNERFMTCTQQSLIPESVVISRFSVFTRTWKNA